MKISYNWLKDFIEINESPETTGEALTQTGLEVEGIEKVEKIPGGFAGLVVGEVLTCEPHPNADKLRVTTVDIGADEPAPIVCGAPNVAKGQKVIVATVNAVLYPTSGDSFKIKKSKIRGEVSMGMICAEDEIGLGTSHDGIIVLDTDKPNGTPAAELFETGEDYVFEIGLTPNRGDATSHLGTARDLKAFYNQPLIDQDTPSFEIKEDRPIKVTLENTTSCPRYSGVTIRGVKVAQSPEWLQWRLKAVGLSPINNIVDITNYVMMSLGQPMHAFDASVVGEEVIVKNANEGEEFITLDEEKRKLTATDLMICNSSSPMCIAGVFGGLDSGVKETTTDIFLESAFFSQDAVRATATRHSISTDSSFRFERGTDPEMTVTALKYAIKLILENAGGYVASDIVDIYPNPIQPVVIPTTFGNFHRLIGEEIPNDRIISILNNLDIETAEITETSFVATVPPFRSEVTREADLVEEVLRIFGFNNIGLDEEISAGYLASFSEKEPYKYQQKLSHFFAGQGYSEILTNSLTNPEYTKAYPIGGTPVEILNKSSEELGFMKTTPLYTGLESIRHNINRKQKNLKFFEFSKIYSKLENGYHEEEILALYLTGDTNETAWNKAAEATQFHDLLQVLVAGLNFVKISNFTTEEVTEKPFGCGLSIKAKNKEIAKIGLLDAALTRYFDIKQEVYYAEINWKNLIKASSTSFTYSAISKYPEVKRDLSLVVDESISFQEIQTLASKTERKLLTRLNVFSVYKGDKLEAGKKSYAISFYLQDKEKTLNDKQIDKVMNNLISAFERQIGAIIRK